MSKVFDHIDPALARLIGAQRMFFVATAPLDPAATLLQSKFKDLKTLSDTRTQKDTLEVFGGEYPGGALYTRAD